MLDAHGRERRYELVLDRFVGPVFLFFKRRLDDALAKDCTAETLEIAWRGIEADPDDDAAILWMLGVAHQVLRRANGSHRHHSRPSDAWSARGDDTVDGSAVRVVGRDGDLDALDALNRLSTRDREIIRLTAWEGLALSEVADVLGCSARGVSFRLGRSMRWLAGQLSDGQRLTKERQRGHVDRYGVLDQIARVNPIPEVFHIDPEEIDGVYSHCMERFGTHTEHPPALPSDWFERFRCSSPFALLVGFVVVIGAVICGLLFIGRDVGDTTQSQSPISLPPNAVTQASGVQDGVQPDRVYLSASPPSVLGSVPSVEVTVASGPTNVELIVMLCPRAYGVVDPDKWLIPPFDPSASCGVDLDSALEQRTAIRAPVSNRRSIGMLRFEIDDRAVKDKGIVIVAWNEEHGLLDTTLVHVEPSPVEVFEPFVRVMNLAAAADGSLWATTSEGVVQWGPDGAHPVVFTEADGLLERSPHEIEVGPDGDVWVAGNGWMAVYDGAWTAFSLPPGSEALAIGPGGVVWSAWGADMIGRWHNGEWDVFHSELSEHQPFFYSWVHDVELGPDGTVWITTPAVTGVVEFDGSRFTTHAVAADVGPGHSGSVAVAPNGDVWVGTYRSNRLPEIGVMMWNGHEWSRFTADNDDFAYSEAEATVGADGTVWVTYSAIGDVVAARFDGTTWSFHDIEDAEHDNVAVDLEGTLWLPADRRVLGFDGVSTTILTVPPPAGNLDGVSAPLGSGYWDDILAVTEVRQAPRAATCPEGSLPSDRGRVDQARPAPVARWDRSAVFDRVWGRIVYIDSNYETWSFDVCTNTWEEMHATGVVPGGVELVYDIDSDITLAMGDWGVWGYDRASNHWQRMSDGPTARQSWVDRHFYDPATGLVVSTRWTDWGTTLVLAYDVEARSWTAVGEVFDVVFSHLMSPATGIDRLVGMREPGLRTITLDLRTGDLVEKQERWYNGSDFELVRMTATEIDTGEARGGTIGFATTDMGPAFCLFDDTELAWDVDCVPNTPGNAIAMPHRLYDGVVWDPINDRLVVFGGGGPWEPDVASSDDVWALDPATSLWTVLLPLSG